MWPESLVKNYSLNHLFIIIIYYYHFYLFGCGHPNLISILFCSYIIVVVQCSAHTWLLLVHNIVLKVVHTAVVFAVHNVELFVFTLLSCVLAHC